MTEHVTLTVEPHPSLAIRAFVTEFPEPIGSRSSEPELLELLQDGGDPPLRRDEAHRAAVRDVFRYGGYKPTGRGKPASEYLVKAVEDGTLGSINRAVDACNAVSLHSGIPISVVDLDRATGPFRAAIAPADAHYVFNASGQTIDLSGLLCLFDAEGPCANGVRDSQRTKTSPATLRTLSILWGAAGHEARLDQAASWYRDLLEASDAKTAVVEPRPSVT